MLRAVSIFAIIGCTNAAVLQSRDMGLNGRIVNGEDTNIEQHPYQVSLQLKNFKSIYEHICGGSLISEDFVVTAAHCVLHWNLDDLAVYLGSTRNNAGGQRIKVLQALAHDKFDMWTTANDVALIKLSEKVMTSATTGFIALSRVTPESNTPAIVSGWGQKCFGFCPSPEILQKAEVHVVSRSDCNSNPYRYSGDIKVGMICARGEKKDACQGDSGGPLVSEGELIGISSWGMYCADAEYPGVYTDVAYFRGWILETMSILSEFDKKAKINK